MELAFYPQGPLGILDYYKALGKWGIWEPWESQFVGIMPSIEGVQVECPYTALTLNNKVFYSILFYYFVLACRLTCLPELGEGGLSSTVKALVETTAENLKKWS